ncbi:MAG: hypothetical protein WCR52_06850 [Bacteroidota bacterium]
MARYNKKYIRILRTDLGRFPVWPLQKQVSLGDILMYHSRNAEYSWHGNLNDMGIVVTPTGAQTVLDESYETENSVDIKVQIDPAADCVVANYTFNKKSAIVAQCFDQSYATLPIEALKIAVNQYMATPGRNWNRDWLIVTELWHAKAYTALLSGSKDSQTIIKSGGMVPVEMFNVANPQLNLSVASRRNMNYVALAKQGVHPFFCTHKLVHWNGRYSLRSYGQ